MRRFIEWTDELIIRREILQNGRSVSRINGQMVNLSVLKQLGNIWWTSMASMIRKNLCGPNCISLCWMNLGMQPFQTKDAYRQTFEELQTPAQTSGGTPAQSAGNKGPYWDVGFQIAEMRLLPWKWMRTCVWNKNANACSITRWLQIP